MQGIWIRSRIGKMPWRKWQPAPVFLPGESYGQWSLVNYNLPGHKESDTTEQLSTVNFLLYLHCLVSWAFSFEISTEFLVRIVIIASWNKCSILLNWVTFVSASSIAHCSVRPDKPKCQSLEQRKVYCRAMQEIGGSCSKEAPSLSSLKGFGKAFLKARWGITGFVISSAQFSSWQINEVTHRGASQGLTHAWVYALMVIR